MVISRGALRRRPRKPKHRMSISEMKENRAFADRQAANWRDLLSKNPYGEKSPTGQFARKKITEWEASVKHWNKEIEREQRRG